MIFQKFIEKNLQKNRALVKQIKTFLKKIGFNAEHWIRYPTYKLIKEDMQNFKTKDMNVLEISGGEYWKENFNFKSYETLNYPDFDICKNIKLEKKYDLIIADNVWEHLAYPYKATKNIYNLLNKNGIFLIIVPFLVRVHNVPIDCSRWTEDGLKYFLNECGFEIDNIKTNSWGNKKCVISNLRGDDSWTRIGFYKDLKNDKNYPVQIWAIAKKN